MTIRVLLVDDEELVRTGLRTILEAETDVAVVGEAVDGGQAVEKSDSLSPDVVLMDVRMPRVDGLEATRRLSQRDAPLKIIVLTTFDLDEHVYEALQAGASGFLLKDAPAQAALPLADGSCSEADQLFGFFTVRNSGSTSVP